MVKLATSTLGCLDWDLTTILSHLPSYGFAAVDFRGYRERFDLWNLPEFSGGIAATARQIREAGLMVSAISSGVRLVWQTDAERAGFVEETKRTLEICRGLAAPQIRVFGGWFKELSRAEALARGREFLAELVVLATDSGVQLAVETHDAWTRGDEVLALIDGTAPERVGVIWDLKHPYWSGQETPALTWAKLKPRLVNVHWKDTQRDPATGKDRLCLCGEGLLPLADCLDLLLAGGYAGFHTLEWERKWHPYLVGAEVAFPGYVQLIGQLHARLAAAARPSPGPPAC